MTKTKTKTEKTAKKIEAPVKAYGDNLEYLQDELEWIEARCRRIIAQRELNERIGESASKEWRPRDEEPLPVLTERLKELGRDERARRRNIDQRLKETRQGDFQLALDALVELYELTDFERTILLMAAAKAFSHRFENLYGDLQNSYISMSIESVFNFCELPFAERITCRRVFSKNGALIQNDLASLDISSRFNAPEDLLNAQVQLANRTFGYLVGDDNFMDEFMEFSSVEEPRSHFEQVVLPEADKQRIMSVVERHDDYLKYRRDWGFDEVIQYGKGALMLFYGKPGTGKTMMAHAVAAKLGKRVLNVDIPAFADNHQADRFLPSLFREARMQSAVRFSDECEVLFGDRRGGNKLTGDQPSGRARPGA